MTFSTSAVVRLALLGLFGAVIQLTVVSKITIFGVPADISPLLSALASTGAPIHRLMRRTN